MPSAKPNQKETPLANAALHCHPRAVDYLLRLGADPTLSGCPDDGVYFTAADKNGLEAMIYQYFIAKRSSLSMGLKKDQTPDEYVDSLFEKVGKARRCQFLVNTAGQFWNPASHATARFSDARANSGYSNRPTDEKGLLAALDAPQTLSSEDEEKLIKRKNTSSPRSRCSKTTTTSFQKKPGRKNFLQVVLTESRRLPDKMQRKVGDRI